LLQNGTLVPGTIVSTDSAFGKIKSLEDTRGAKIDKLYPSQPAVAIGFDEVPMIGDSFGVMESLETAHDFVTAKQRTIQKNAAEKIETAPKDNQKTINIVLKADVAGSLEVLKETIGQIPANDDVALKIIGTAAGEISLNDIKMARSGNAVIIGFRVKINPDAKAMAEKEKIRVMNFEIIYEMIEWLRGYMEKAKVAQIVRKDLGKMKVLLSFWAEKSRQIVGGKITEGEVKKGVKIEVFRNEKMVGQGRLINLQKNKKDIGQAGKGEEVGILYEGQEKIQEGDYLVFYVQEKSF
jgi:translation initiation factor IF-2